MPDTTKNMKVLYISPGCGMPCSSVTISTSPVCILELTNVSNANFLHYWFAFFFFWRRCFI